MAHINESIANFLDALASRLGELLSPSGAGESAVSWTPRDEESFRPELTWWSAGLSVDPECRSFAGAPVETWEEIGRGRDADGGDALEASFNALAEALQQVAAERFGSEVSCTEAGSAGEPPLDWTGVSFEMPGFPALDFVLSPELVQALGGSQDLTESGEFNPDKMDPNAVDRLLHVEIPVSVSFGRTQLRMKDLLSLTHGSIVELDQELSEDVEVRVNNCVIARGEVVEVDGNYGVRILKMMGRDSRALAEAGK